MAQVFVALPVLWEIWKKLLSLGFWLWPGATFSVAFGELTSKWRSISLSLSSLTFIINKSSKRTRSSSSRIEARHCDVGCEHPSHLTAALKACPLKPVFVSYRSFNNLWTVSAWWPPCLYHWCKCSSSQSSLCRLILFVCLLSTWPIPWPSFTMWGDSICLLSAHLLYHSPAREMFGLLRTCGILWHKHGAIAMTWV